MWPLYRSAAAQLRAAVSNVMANSPCVLLILTNVVHFALQAAWAAQQAGMEARQAEVLAVQQELHAEYRVGVPTPSPHAWLIVPLCRRMCRSAKAPVWWLSRFLGSVVC